jgi:hypothetical protein
MTNPSSWLKKALISTTHLNLALALAVLALLLLSGGWISVPGVEAGMVALGSSITSTSTLNGTFATSETAPTVTTNDATSIATTSATVNGYLDDLGTAENVTVSFEWGITLGGPYPNETISENLTSAAAFFFDLSGLDPGTPYYYLAKAVGDGTSYGSERSFTTLTTPPAVTTNAGSSITTNSARLNGNLGNLGTASSVTVSFVWGTTLGGPYPNETAGESMSSTGAFYFDQGSLTPGTTYYYKAKADGDGSPVYGDERSFTTLTTPPAVTTNDATSIATTSATLNGNLTSRGTADSVTVSFQWGTSLGGPYPNETTGQAMTSTGVFSAGLSSLTHSTIYYYRAKAVGHGTVYGVERSFTTLTPPEVTTNVATNITTTSARLNGDLTSLGTAASVTVSFQWGTSSGSYPNETTGVARTAIGTFYVDLGSLTHSTTYYYRAKAVGDSTVYGVERNFTTLTPPVVTTNAATSITINSARLNGNLTSRGTASNVTVSFVWGTSSGSYPYETTGEDMATTGTFYFNLGSLTHSTTYYYRTKAVGDSTVYGGERSFTTLTPPAVTTNAASNVTTNSARLNGDLTSLGTAGSVAVSFEWGTSSGSYPNETTGEVKDSTGTFYFNLGTLSPTTAYYYRAKAVGDSTVYGVERSFTTLTPPTVTTNAASDVTTNSARLNGNLTSLGTAGSVTVSFEWGTSSGSYPNETTGQAMTGTGAFYFDLGGLDHSDTYYYRAKAVGDSTVYGVERNFTTLTPPTVTTSSATGITTNSARLNGNLTSLGTAGSVAVSFVWGTSSGSYPYETAGVEMTGTGTFYFDLGSLAHSATYYCRAKAVGDSTVYGVERNFTTLTPPAVTTNAATSITTTSARLNGDLTSLGTAGSVTVSFVWGTSSGSYPNETAAVAKTAIGTFYFDLGSLAHSTTFYYRAKAVGDSTVYGVERSFTTLTPPAVTTNVATSITTTSGRLNGDLTSLGTAGSVTVSFEWGTTSGSYSNATTGQAMTSTGAFYFDLGSLAHSATYYYRAKAAGDSTVYGVERSFTTLTPPTVTTNAASSVTTTSARLNGDLTNLGTAGSVTVSFQWGASSGSYPNETAAVAKTAIGIFYFDLGSLAHSTTYYYRAKAVGDSTVYGVERSFTTPTPPAVTTNDASYVTINSVRFNGNLTSRGTASSVTVSFEWGTSSGSYSGGNLGEDMTSTGAFYFDWWGPEVTPGTTYYYRAKAVGASTVYGEEKSFTTLTTPPAVTTNDASNKATTSATLNGNLTSRGTASSVTVSFEWGTTLGGPYPNETTGQVRTSTGTFYFDLPGLIPGTTYYYKAKAVGVHGTGYGAEKSFTTTTTPPAVTTNDASNVTTTSATLNGNLTSLGTVGSVTVSFVWGTSVGGPYPNETTGEVKTSTGAFYFDLPGLIPGTTYYYQAKAVGGHGTSYGVEKSFTALTTPPVVTTEVATSIDLTSATLNGNLDGLGTAPSVQVSFEWGLTAGYGNTTDNQTMTGGGAFSANIILLTQGTTYHYRAKAVGHGAPIYGVDMQFTTPPPPSVTTKTASQITTSSARLNGDLGSLGSTTSVTVSFGWGTFAEANPEAYPYWTNGEVRTSIGAFYFDLSGLIPGTTYYYQAKAVGNGTSYGGERSLKIPVIPPVVTTGAATGVGNSSATLNGELTSLGTAAAVQVSFEWGLTASYGNTTDLQNMTGTGAFSANISGLTVGSTYHYRTKVVGDGAPVYGSDRSFTTSTPPSVTTNTATGTGSTSVTLSGNLTSLGTADSVTVSFVWGTTLGGPYPNETTGVAKTVIGTFYFDLPGLSPGTTYYYQAKAAGDGTSYGVESSFTTLVPPAVTTNAASSITTNSARLNSDLTSLGTASSVTVSFVWGTSPGSYPNETATTAKTAAGTFYLDLSGLSPGTTYYFRAKAVGDGDPAYGAEKTFIYGVGGPSVVAVVADKGSPSDELIVSISGSNLSGVISVDFGSGITVKDIWLVGDGEITARIAIDGDAEFGARDVSVTTSGGMDTKIGGFTVAAASPGWHWWSYLAAIVGGLMVLCMLVYFAAWLVRRLAR